MALCLKDTLKKLRNAFGYDEMILKLIFSFPDQKPTLDSE
jgi:hypothetical protein